MKVLKKVLMFNNDVLEECKVLIDNEGIKVLLSGRAYLRLLGKRSSLSLSEYEVLSRMRRNVITIGVNDLVGFRYYRVSRISKDVRDLFSGYAGKNTNIYDAHLETRSDTYRFLLIQRDMIKLRNYIRKLLHSNK